MYTVAVVWRLSPILPPIPGGGRRGERTLHMQSIYLNPEKGSIDCHCCIPSFGPNTQDLGPRWSHPKSIFPSSLPRWHCSGVRTQRKKLRPLYHVTAAGQTCMSPLSSLTSTDVSRGQDIITKGQWTSVEPETKEPRFRGRPTLITSAYM